MEKMMVFEVKNPDYNKSPYTGMTREHWLDAGRYLLEGIFGNIKSMDDSVVMPRKETKVTYPHLDASKEQQEIERRAEIFEGLTRSFFIASVMIRNEPEIEVNGIRLRDYYKNIFSGRAQRATPCMWAVTGICRSLWATRIRSAAISRRWKAARW